MDGTLYIRKGWNEGESEMQIQDKLYLATIAEDAPEIAKEYGLGIEIDEFCTAGNMDGGNFPVWNEIVQKKLQASGRRIFHAPFNELIPCAIDPMVRDIAKTRLNQAYRLSVSYGINRMVVHSGHIPSIYYDSWFLERSVEFWKEFMGDKPDWFSVMIENVLEEEPYILAKLIEEIGDNRVMACLDIGHAYYSGLQPINEWVMALGKHIGHVHLHNNDKCADQHSPLGEGGIDYRDVLHALSFYAPDATYTIESICCKKSLQWLIDNGYFSF